MVLIQSLLLVDDDQDDQQLFIDALGSVDSSVRVNFANDGMEALEKLQNNHPAVPDLILLDLNMPRMNGKQFLQTIKSSERLKDIPVVVYSTSSNENDKRETAILGAADFIVKPLRFLELCDSIRYLLGKRWRP